MAGFDCGIDGAKEVAKELDNNDPQGFDHLQQCVNQLEREDRAQFLGRVSVADDKSVGANLDVEIGISTNHHWRSNPLYVKGFQITRPQK